MDLIQKIDADLKGIQSKELYEHSISTRDYALKLAEKHNLSIDKEKIILAALLHDYAKEYKESKLFQTAGEAGYVFDDIELENPYLLHGEIGAYEAKRIYGIDDEEILQAISSHTTGSSKMNDLALLIFLADKLEDTRNYEGIDKLRQSAEKNFLKASLEVFKTHKNHVLAKNQKLHPRTQLAIDYLQERLHPRKIKFSLPAILDPSNETNPQKRRDIVKFLLTMDGFIVLCTAICVFITFLGSLIFGLWFMYNSIETYDYHRVPFGLGRSKSPAVFFQNRKELLFVIAGLDGIHNYERTDTLMLAKINFSNGTVKILSIPRDTLVNLPSARGDFWDRINVAYPIGKEKLLLDTIANLIGYYPDYLVLINYDGFKTIVDIVGGVEIDVEKDMHYDDYAGKLHIHIEKGLQVLNGENALNYVRYRRDYDGDFSRIKRQQKFFQAFKQSLMSPATAFKIDDIVRAIMANVDVTAILPGTEDPELVPNGMSFQQYIVLAKILKSLPDENISSDTLKMRSDGEMYNGRAVQVLDYDEFDRTIEHFFAP